MWYWKWPQFWKKWASRNCVLKVNGFYMCFFLQVNKSTATVSTTISLLSTLCRGSEAITHNLLRSNLAEAIESALQGDERCTLDTMRLIDLLLVLLFEGKGFFVCCYFWQTLWIETSLKGLLNAVRAPLCIRSRGLYTYILTVCIIATFLGANIEFKSSASPAAS